MKKRLSILMLAVCLLFSQITVNAQEKEVSKGLSGYVNLLLAKTKSGNDNKSLSSLKDSLEDAIQNIKPEDAQKILDFVSEKIQDGSWETKQGIESAIKEAEKQFDVTLTKEQKDLVFSVAQKVKNLGIDPQFLVDQAEEIYKKYSNEIKDEVSKKGQKIAEERLHCRRHFCHIRVDGVSVGVYEQNAAVCVVALNLRKNVVERRTERD